MGAIAKRELLVFYKNPIGWFAFAVYGFLSAFFFSYFVIWQNTSYLGDYFGYWLFFVDMIIVSILSMRFFAEETKNRTDQLLLTSPITIWQLVLGKFFGSYLIMLTMTVPLNLAYVLIIDVYGAIDYGQLLTNAIGTALILAAFVSIALFISSCTENGIAAAAGTLGIFILMFGIDFIAMFLPGYLQYIAYINIFIEFDDFSNGILSIHGIVYYLSATLIFLYLTVKKIEKRRWS